MIWHLRETTYKKHTRSCQARQIYPYQMCHQTAVLAPVMGPKGFNSTILAFQQQHTQDLFASESHSLSLSFFFSSLLSECPFIHSPTYVFPFLCVHIYTHTQLWLFLSHLLAPISLRHCSNHALNLRTAHQCNGCMSRPSHWTMNAKHAARLGM